MKNNEEINNSQSHLTKEDFLKILDRAISPIKPPYQEIEQFTCCQGILV